MNLLSRLLRKAQPQIPRYRTADAYAGVNDLSERLGLGRPCHYGMPVQDFLDAVAKATAQAPPERLVKPHEPGPV